MAPHSATSLGNATAIYSSRTASPLRVTALLIMAVIMTPFSAGRCVAEECVSAWEEITDRRERIAILQNIINRSRDSSDRIRTWKGKYRTHGRSTIDGDYAQTLAAGYKGRGEFRPPFLATNESTHEFSADYGRNTLFCETMEAGRQFTEIATGRPLHEKSGPVTYRLLVTPQEWTTFFPALLTGRLRDDPFPAKENDPPAIIQIAGRKQPIGGPAWPSDTNAWSASEFCAFEPKTLYGREYPAWDQLAMYVNGLGHKDPAIADQTHEMLAINRWRNGGQTLVSVKSIRPTWVNEYIFSSEHSYLPISRRDYAVDPTGCHKIQNDFSWEYMTIGEIRIPRKATLRTYNSAQALESEICISHLESEINRPISPESTSLKALGAPEGTRILDMRNKSISIFREGRKMSLKEFQTRFPKSR